MRRFFALLFIPFFAWACNKCEDTYRNCTLEKISWIAYSGGETIILKRNDGVFDTVQVGQINNNYNVLSPASMDGRTCASYIQKVDINLTGKYNKMNISVDGINDALIVFIDGRLWGGMGNPPQDNVIINNINYNSVYITQYDTSNISQSTQASAWKIYYTRQHGILRLDFTKGAFWEKTY